MVLGRGHRRQGQGHKGQRSRSYARSRVDGLCAQLLIHYFLIRHFTDSKGVRNEIQGWPVIIIMVNISAKVRSGGLHISQSPGTIQKQESLE